MSYHDHNSIRHKRLSAAALVLLTLCTLGWGTQLAGVIMLQKVCKDDLPVQLNNMDVIRGRIASLGQLARAPATAESSAQIMQGTVAVLQQLAYRTTTTAFAFTPEHTCKEFYRYQWFNVAMQAFVLLLAFICLFTRYIHNARVTLATLFAVATILAIENAHSFLHVRHTAPTSTLHRGMVFFAGCVFTAAMNLLLILLLGSRGRKNHEVRSSTSSDNGHVVQARLHEVVTHNGVRGPATTNVYQHDSPVIHQTNNGLPVHHASYVKNAGDGRPIYAA